MKKYLSLAFAAAVCGMAFTSCEVGDDNFVIHGTSYRILTFEDEDWKADANYVGGKSWSSLIDDKQYEGALLYPGEGGALYQWKDENNTFLAHEFPNSYGDMAYWGGGHAVSNYTGVAESTATYEQQLGIPNATGHNGSKNFCVHNGYKSNDYITLPALYFSDKVTRVIDHMYVTNTSYTLNEMRKEGSPFQNGTDWLKIVARGYNANGLLTGKVEFYLAKDGKFVTDWEKFELRELGAVVRVEFDMEGSCTNEWGLETPAYFAYDDVTVIESY